MTAKRDPFELRRAGGCLSQLQLDRLLAGEEEGLQGARDHLRGCERCYAHLEELRLEQKESLQTAGVGLRVSQALARAAPAERGSWRRLLRPVVWAPALAAAAAAILVLLALPAPPSPDVVRLKGARLFEVLLVVEGKAQARPLAPSDRLAPGDRLVFRVGSPTPTTVSVVSLDRTGAPTFLSYQERHAWSLEAGPPSQLPLSAQLDEAAGDERVFAAFCPGPPPRAQLAAALERAYPRRAGGRRDLRRAPLAEAAGCALETVLLRRRGRGADGR